MSDDQKPLFFGGLPPRDSSAAAEVAPESEATAEAAEADDRKLDWPKIRKWTLFGIVVACVLAASLVAVLAMFPSLTESPIPENIAPGHGGTEYVAPEEETAATEAAVAEGGGAVSGHTVSAELCAALGSFVDVSPFGITSANVSEVTLAALETLAAVESPNQAAYQGFANLVKDPASVETTDAAETLSVNFAKAAEVDIVTCM